jgi:hypothetical protein
MLPLEHTSHGTARIRQRGVREVDAALILEFCTEVWPGMFMMTNQDANALIAEISALPGIHENTVMGMSSADLKRRIDSLRGCAVVADGLTLITVFHKVNSNLRTDPRKDPRCRRRSKRRDAERRRRSFNVCPALG